MAQRRMFSPEIIESEDFLSLPVSSQALYFHLAMNADDDGFIQPQKIMRMVGSSGDDLKILLAKRFLLSFETGVVVIKHWLIHNLIRGDRYKGTRFIEEKKALNVKENKAYTEIDKSGCQIDNQCPPQVRLGKDSIGKDRLVKDIVVVNDKLVYGEFKNVSLSEEEYNKLIEKLGDRITNLLIEELSGYMASKKTKYINHYATLLNWARRKGQEQQNKLNSRAKPYKVIE